MEHAGLVDAAVGVGTEEVTLGLGQGGGQTLGAQTIVVRQGAGEHRGRDTGLHGTHDYTTPCILRFADDLLEVRIEQQGSRQIIALEGLGDAVEQELGANNAAATPNAGHFGQVDIPAVFLSTVLNLVQALSIGHDLGSEQGLAHVLDERGLVFSGQIDGLVRASQTFFLSVFTQLTVRRQCTSEHGFTDSSHRRTKFQTSLHGPSTSTLHAGMIHDHVHERLAGLGILVVQNLSGDLDQVGVKVALVPFSEHVANLLGIHAESTAQNVIRLTNHLHIGILDAVVHHLDKVTGTIGADVGHARFAVHLGGDGLKNRAQGLPGFRSATRHQRRAVERAFLTTGHAATHEVEALGTYFLLTLDGVLEEGVATVDDDVARFEHLFQLRDSCVGRSTGLDHDDGGTRTLQGRGEFLERFGRHEVAFGAMLVHELLGTRVVTVEQRHRVAMVRQITRQIGAHRGQSNHTNVCCSFGHAPCLSFDCPIVITRVTKQHISGGNHSFNA